MFFVVFFFLFCFFFFFFFFFFFCFVLFHVTFYIHLCCTLVIHQVGYGLIQFGDIPLENIAIAYTDPRLVY